MKKEQIKIMDINELKSYVKEYFEYDKSLVMKVVGIALDCYCWDIFDNLTLDEFQRRIDLHYKFIQGLPSGAEKPLFLLDEPTLKDEFSIDKLTR